MNGAAGSISVVAPVYNEQENLSEFIRRTEAVLDSLGRPAELILVDDGSRDSSAELIAAAAQRRPGLIVGVFFNRNYGQHTAVIAGLEESRGETVITIDSDLQNPPEEIPRLLAEADQGFDVVGTRRAGRRDHLFRKISSWMINKITARATGVSMHDYGCMLRAYSRSVIEAVLQCSERSTFIPVLANTFAYRVTEIEVAHAERTAGKSKYGFFQLINLQFDLLTSMTTFPLRLLSVVGVLVSIFGLALAAVILILRLIMGPEWAAEGVFTLFAIVFVFMGGQFIALGLIGEYIGRIYTEARARPRYFVRGKAGRSALPIREKESGVVRSVGKDIETTENT